jgi:hypothetical protein
MARICNEPDEWRGWPGRPSVASPPFPPIHLAFVTFILAINLAIVSWQSGNITFCSVGKPEGKRPLGKPRRRWEFNVKMDLREIRWGGMDWIDLAQDRDQWRALVSTLMNFRVP